MIRNQEYKIKHGGYGTQLYAVWAGMKSRCNNPNSHLYNYYGARGIKVCERWANDFAAFLSDMGNRPSPKHSLDRIDNDGNYEPGNCRWATLSQQNGNRRTSRKLTHNGETLHAEEWARRLGVNASTLLYRMDSGWSDELVLTTPVRPYPGKRKRCDATRCEAER